MKRPQKNKVVRKQYKRRKIGRGDRPENPSQELYDEMAACCTQFGILEIADKVKVKAANLALMKSHIQDKVPADAYKAADYCASRMNEVAENVGKTLNELRREIIHAVAGMNEKFYKQHAIRLVLNKNAQGARLWGEFQQAFKTANGSVKQLRMAASQFEKIAQKRPTPTKGRPTHDSVKEWLNELFLIWRKYDSSKISQDLFYSGRFLEFSVCQLNIIKPLFVDETWKDLPSGIGKDIAKTDREKHTEIQSLGRVAKDLLPRIV